MVDIWLDRLTEGLALAQDEQTATDILAKLTVEAGFIAYSYLDLHADNTKAISNYPFEWQKRYFEKAYARVDPVVREAKVKMAAFPWSILTVAPTSRERRQFMAEAADFGIRSGISIPVSTGYGRLALFTLASSQIDARALRAFNPVLAAAAIAQLHVRLSTIAMRPTARREVNLKSEEISCLRWSAEGKSMQAIAVIENTSYANVVFFLRNAKAALGATTLPQATALAKEFGLI